MTIQPHPSDTMQAMYEIPDAMIVRKTLTFGQ
jgi:hypothetical protein